MNILRNLCLLVLLGLSLAACNSDSTSSNTNNPNNNSTGVTAKVDGTAWAATTVQSTWSNNTIELAGWKSLVREAGRSISPDL